MKDKKLKIALCCDAFFPMVDGVINAVHNYASKLSEKHDVTVFVPESPDKNFVDNFPYKVVRCKNLPIKFGDYVTPLPLIDKNFRNQLNQNFDIIHLHSPFTISKSAIKVAKKRKIPLIITLHSQYKQDFKEKTKSNLLTKFMMKYIAKSFNACDELWTMNPKMADLSHEYGYTGGVFVLPNGCDLNKHDIQDNKVDTFRLQYATRNEKLLLYVGRIHILKNIEFILKVCEKLKEKHFPFKMVFVGNGQDFEKFKKMSKNMHLEDSVIFVGKVTDRDKIQYFYKVSDLFVFPSNYDTDGIVKTEAAAYQTPTIFLKDTIVSSCVQDNYNGYIGENDTIKFADKIVDIFKDEQNYKTVCINAEKTLYLTWNDIIAKAEKHYYEIIEEHKKGEEDENKIRRKKQKNLF